MADPSILERKLDQPSHKPGRMNPFRFGVNVGRAGSRAAWADKARKLEELGYATLTVPDHQPTAQSDANVRECDSNKTEVRHLRRVLDHHDLHPCCASPQ